VQIVVNTRLLLKNRLEGIGWFSYQTLIRITRAHPEVHFVFLFDRPFDEAFVFSENVTPLILYPQARHPLLYYAYFQHSVRQILNKLQPDVFFSPDGFLSLGAKCRQIPVIHDINFFHHPTDSRWLTSKYYNYYFPRFAKAAAKIVTVSEFSKQDISSSFQVDPNKIDVVYNGLNAGFKVATEEEKTVTRQRFSSNSPYFLHVGSLHPRKNIPNLIKAFNTYKLRSGADKKLILAGPEFWGVTELKTLWNASPYKADIIFTGRLSQDDLAAVTAAAFALCMVSFYEGFGIPLIEAMACGVPVICSDRSALPEIAGNAALYVDPYAVNSITEAMLEMENDQMKTQQLIRNGQVQKEKFTWEKSAHNLWQSISSVL
jgi:glycosyltransferase involved in cell wall biosynthesis